MIGQWSGREARVLRSAMRMSIREFAAHLGVHERLVSKWEAGGSRVHPRPVNQAALDTCLARSDEVVRARFGELSAAESETHEQPGGAAAIPERELIMAAAHEASEHVSHAESSNVGTVTLQQLDADVSRLARDYLHAAPAGMMREMVRVRRRVYRLLEGRQRPADTGHLYLLAGMLSGLLANASTDLGYLDAASEQVRAAWAYSELCGHNGLRAWTRGMHALIEYWSGHPRRSVLLAQSGKEYADSGTAAVRLHNIEARMWSQLGNSAATEQCIQAAQDARDGSGTEELHDEVGGVFGFSEGKASYYAATTFLQLGMADPALSASLRALELYEQGPPEQRAYGTEALTRVDAAAAYLLRGEPEGAAEALTPVLELTEDKRIAQLTERLSGVRRHIAAPSYRGVAVARELDERIEEFCSALGPSSRCLGIAYAPTWHYGSGE